MSFPYDSILTSKGKTIVSAAASLTASAFLFRTIANELVPAPLQDYFSSRLRKLSSHLSFQLTILIQDHDGLTPNHMFHAADLYLGTRLSPSTRRIKVNKPDIDDDLIISVDKNQEITDIFHGIKFVWILHSTVINSNSKVVSSNSKPRTEQRSFELSCRKKYREVALKTYLPYILEKAKEIREQNKAVRLHMVDYNGPSYWGSVVLNHPASFDTMAMDPDAKRELIEDLERFINRKDYYRKVGKAWKRGYLFYGPPGTGKSSLVAAMANYLKFDIYDLALEEVQCNSDLRRLLIGTANQSILVIEDIDCSVGFESRNSDEREAEATKITLSGLLNFIDGLWSSCGDERIIVFTTNHKDRLDPALLRPGRMDVHLEMSYCTFAGFKILASNYLGVHEHHLFDEIQELLVKVQATPAEVAGELMKGDNAEIALQCLVTKLQAKHSHAVALEEKEFIIAR